MISIATQMIHDCTFLFHPMASALRICLKDITGVLISIAHTPSETVHQLKTIKSQTMLSWEYMLLCQNTSIQDDQRFVMVKNILSKKKAVLVITCPAVTLIR